MTAMMKMMMKTMTEITMMKCKRADARKGAEHMEDITSYIPLGNDNRITSKELTAVTGIGGAGIRKAVNEARQNGIPVCSDKNGYFISYDTADIRNTIQQLKHRTDSILTAVSGLTVTYRKEMLRDGAQHESR